MEISTTFVAKFYQMDPEFDDLIPEGRDLRDGMIVLIEDSFIRANDDRKDEYNLERLLEMNRWCTVSHVRVRPRYEHSDMGDITVEMSPLISFVATYPDGSKKKRTMDNSYAWLVKIDSLPKGE